MDIPNTEEQSDFPSESKRQSINLMDKPLILLEHAKTVLDNSIELKNEVILQTNELIEILRLRQLQLCREIDETSLQQYNLTDKQLLDNLHFLSDMNLEFQSDFEFLKMILKEFGKITAFDKTDKLDQAVLVESGKQTKGFACKIGNLLKNIKLTKNSPTNSESNDGESVATIDSFEVIENDEKAELQNLERESAHLEENLPMDNVDDLEIISSDSSELHTGSESDFSPKHYQNKSNKSFWRKVEVMRRQLKQALLIKSLVANEESTLNHEVANSSTLTTQLLNNQSPAESFQKGLFSQVFEEANKNTSWLKESSMKSNGVNEIFSFQPHKEEKTYNSSWLIKSEENKAKETSPSQTPIVEDVNDSSWLLKSSRKSKEKKEITPSQTLNVEKDNNNASWLTKSLKESKLEKDIDQPLYVEEAENSPWLTKSLEENRGKKDNPLQIHSKDEIVKSTLITKVPKESNAFTFEIPMIEKTKIHSPGLMGSYFTSTDLSRVNSLKTYDAEEIQKPPVNAFNKPSEMLKFSLETYLEDNPREWLYTEIITSPPKAVTSKLSSRPAFKNVFEKWLCSKDSLDTWLTQRK